MGRNDLQIGDVIRCHDLKDLMTYVSTLRFLGYTIEVNQKTYEVIIQEIPEEHNEKN